MELIGIHASSRKMAGLLHSFILPASNASFCDIYREVDRNNAKVWAGSLVSSCSFEVVKRVVI